MGHLGNETKSRFDKTPVQWLGIGSAINDLVNVWAERTDIVTFVGEGAGMGAPACFIPAIAEMEVNVSVAFGESVDPEFIGDLSQRKIQFDHPVAMGAIMHEAFHARHSTLELLMGIGEEKDEFVRNLATWFEETRIERRAVQALPKNKAFLRACALRLVIGDLKEDGDFTERGIKAFSQLMLLTLARVDAGVLRSKDVRVVEDAARKLFDHKTYNKLRALWCEAQRHSEDTDAEPLLGLARQWVEVLEESGQDMSAPDGGDVPEWLKELLQQMVGNGDEGENGEGGSSSGGSGMLSDMAEDTELLAQNEANDQAVQEFIDEVNKARSAAAEEAAKHAETAREVFGRGTGPGGVHTSSTLIDERPATASERSAAVALSKALERARYRDRVAVKKSSVVPPGRLNVRRAMAAAEQSSRGVEVSAEPWTRKQRFHTEDPNLTVGVLVDISGSMSSAMQPMASAAWILSEASRRVQGKCAMVYYGNDVFPTLKPGQHLDQVKVYSAPDGTEKFDKRFRHLTARYT